MIYEKPGFSMEHSEANICIAMCFFGRQFLMWLQACPVPWGSHPCIVSFLWVRSSLLTGFWWKEYNKVTGWDVITKPMIPGFLAGLLFLGGKPAAILWDSPWRARDKDWRAVSCQQHVMEWGVIQTSCKALSPANGLESVLGSGSFLVEHSDDYSLWKTKTRLSG